jgi:PPE-repeat protein
VLDFGELPPEINSGRMYSGPGSGPMLVAAAAWEEVAAELGMASSGYSSVISELTSGPWVGPTSASMVSAVVPYVTWLGAVTSQAEQTAGQARAAAAAFEAAFAMTVPPPVIAANRVLLMTLLATNFFGQNTPAIAATDAQYMEMWAQDAAAMYSYAGSSALASQLSVFASPPNTTTPDAVAGQSVAVAHAIAMPAGNSAQTTAATTPQLVSATTVPPVLQQFWTALTDPSSSPMLQELLSLVPTATNTNGINQAVYTEVFHNLLQIYNAYGVAPSSFQWGQQLVFGQGSTAGSGAWYPTPQFAGLHLSGAGGVSGHTAGAVSANLASSTKVGGLSVPPGWATPTSEVSPAIAGVEGVPGGTPAHAAATSGTGNGLLRGMPTGAGRQRADGGVNGYGFRYNVVARPPSAG